MTQKQEIGYKVLKANRMSALSGVDIGGVKYLKRKKTIPQKNCGPLCVFDSLAPAKSFLRLFLPESGLLVKCKYTPSTLEYIWSMPGLTRIPNSQCVEHTILADSVTALE